MRPVRTGDGLPDLLGSIEGPPSLEATAFRMELRGWLEEHAPGRPPSDPVARRAYVDEWSRMLAEGRWAAPAWPEKWGGRDATAFEQIAYHEEMNRSRIPRTPASLGISLIGPVMIRHATESQRHRFLAPMLRGEEIWCQGFSEPDAGSDLASLGTTAQRRDDYYVVNGQKVWTSNAHIADWMFALVRTSRGGADRHEGISCLVLNLRGPGVTVAPIRQMTGEMGFSQVFLDNVEVPADHLVGEEGGGWTIARTTLGFERATAFLAQQIRYLDIYEQLIEMARPVALAARRDDIVRGWIEVRILRLNAVRTLLDSLRRGSPGPESAINRLLLSRFEQRVHELALDVLGMGGLVMPGNEFSVQSGRWAHGFLRTRASTIGSGTSEMQMLALAEKVLGLPSDPSPAHG